jgi:transcriptional regulator with PAS, ATPase and Fis domain
MPRPPAPGRLVARLLDAADAPLYALDHERRIVFANRALGDWLGINAETLLGQQCNYAADGPDDLAALCGALCPPPEAFTSHSFAGEIIRPANSDLPLERRPARFLHFISSDPKQNLLLVAVLPANHQEQAQPPAGTSGEQLHAQLIKLRIQLGQRFSLTQLIGESDAILRVREQARLASDSGTRTLLLGPLGSGREHLARTIHYSQPAGSIGLLMPIDCRLVDAEQLQAQLTSLLRGQHEHPTERPPAALLLEVDRLRPAPQQELAGFLQLPRIDLKTISTARVSLDRLAAKGRFRPDLAHKLSTLTIRLPALAARRNDIPLLAQHFLEEQNATGGKQLSGFQPAALELLAALPWKKNLDELSRAVSEACARATGPRVTRADFPDWVHLAQHDSAHTPRREEPIQLDAFLAEIEKELLQRALRRARGNKSRAAELLGTSRQRLLRRLVQLGLAPSIVEEPVIFEPLPDDTPPP